MLHLLRLLQIVLALVVLMFCTAPQADAGPIFLSGDSNIITPLGGSPIDPGNPRFFQNILAGGSRVLVQGTLSTDEVNGFYNGLGGVSSSILAGPVTGASLDGVNLFIGVIPTSAYAASETAALKNFLAGGGTVFFLGENAVFTARNANINAALVALGSGLSIIDDAFDPLFHTAVGAQITSDPFTTGVGTFTYAAPSRVGGGTTLFFGTGGQPFVAYESGQAGPIPEPTTMLLLGTGLAGIGGMIRRRRQAQAK